MTSRTERPPHTVSARSRVNGLVLSWTDLTHDPDDPHGEWKGDRSAVLHAEALSLLGVPVDLSVDIRSVTPDESLLIYSLAVMNTVLGPADWIYPPPDGFDDEFRFDGDDDLDGVDVPAGVAESSAPHA